MSTETLRDAGMEILYSNRRGKDFTPPAQKHYDYALFLWDNGLIDFRYAEGDDPDTARLDFEKLLSTQNKETGFIPNMTFLGKGQIILDLERLLVFGPRARSSDYSQPPLLAMSALRIHKAFIDQGRPEEADDFLTTNYDGLASFFRYFKARQQGNGQKGEDPKALIDLRDPHESGRDSDEVWDPKKKILGIPLRIPYEKVPSVLDAPVRRLNGVLDYIGDLKIGVMRRIGKSNFAVADVMFNCIYAENLANMAEIAEITNHSDDSQEFRQRALQTEREVVEKMWDEQDRAFYVQDGGSPIKKVSVGSLFPLILDTIEPNQVEGIMAMLEDQDMFNTPYPVPSIPVSSPNYDPAYKEPRLWRGPVWINMNWYIVRGLQKQAARFKDLDHVISERAGNLAQHITLKTKELVQKSGYREFYHPHTGEGLRVQDFAWSTLADTL